MPKVKTSMTIGTFSTLVQALCSIYGGRAEALSDGKLGAFFADAGKKVDALIGASNGSRSLSNIEEADGKRDAVVRNFFTVLEAALVSPFEEEAAAALALKGVFDRYGRKIAADKNREESAKIESLLNDLEKADNAASLKKIHGGAEYAALLRSAEDGFKAASAEYTKAIVAASGEKSAYAQKRELMELLNSSVLPYVSAQAVVNPELYAPLLQEMETEIARANASVKSAKASKSAEPAQE